MRGLTKEVKGTFNFSLTFITSEWNQIVYIIIINTLVLPGQSHRGFILMSSIFAITSGEDEKILSTRGRLNNLDRHKRQIVIKLMITVSF